MFVNKLFTYSRVHISKNKTCLNAKSSAYYFYMTTKILPDFRICISVPLRNEKLAKKFQIPIYRVTEI